MTGSCFTACWRDAGKNRRSGSQPSTPIGMVADKPYPPFLLVHGDKDPVVPYEQERGDGRDPSPATASTPN